MASQNAKSQPVKIQHVMRGILSADEMDLYELANLSGVIMDPPVFK